MLRLMYFSTGAAGIRRSDVEMIVAHASKANSRRDITGALAFNGMNFCQCLEGEDQDVLALMEKIRADERHSGIKVIHHKAIEKRHFPDWSMHLVDGLNFNPIIDAMEA